jgi:hypothetical protein
MATLARNHHDSLQYEDNQHPLENPDDQEALLREIMSAIPETQLLEDPEQSEMNREITQVQVTIALRSAKLNTAVGVDGCPYELWRALMDCYDTSEDSDPRRFDIVNVLTTVFNDIQQYGVDPTTNFARGWMCPIFKKKDPTDISNYRPITVLNTDYKLFTKAFALQLMKPISRLVHPDQAGFIPGRSIFNQIRLAKAILNYAEVMEADGSIIALDQEKAYDKIKHNYLWKMLETYKIPQLFIRTIKSLYKNATTQVAINGFFSEPFKVTRGIH